MVELFKKIDKISEESLHRKFKLLRDELYYGPEKEILDDWAKDFFDRDGKIVREFQTTFHSSFWEIYLHKVFQTLGYKTLDKYPHPDFIINSPFDLYIEAVVSEIKKSGIPECSRTIEDVMKVFDDITTQHDYDQVIREGIVRNSNSITTKLKAYKNKYVKESYVNTKTPYVIALSSYGQISYGSEYIYSIIPLLYGFLFNNKNQVWEKKEYIEKPDNGSEIHLGLFDCEENSFLSGVLFSSNMSLGKITSMSISDELNQPCPKNVFNIRYCFSEPHYRIQEISGDVKEKIFDGLYFLPNPNAINPVPEDAFDMQHILHIYIDKGGLALDGANCPLVARVSIPFIEMMPGNIKTILHSKIMSSYNRIPIENIIEVTQNNESK